VWIWKIFPKSHKFFKKSLQLGSKSTRVKDGSASYLLRVKDTFGLGQGPSLLQITITLAEPALLFFDTLG